MVRTKWPVKCLWCKYDLGLLLLVIPCVVIALVLLSCTLYWFWTIAFS